MDREVIGLPDQGLGMRQHPLEVRFSGVFAQHVIRAALAPAVWAGAEPAVGQVVDQLVGWDAEGFSHFAQSGAFLQAVDGGHHRDSVPAVLLEDVVDDAVAASRAQIRVDVGRCRAGRVQKALEVEVQRQRIGRRDVQAVRHER